MKGNMLIKNASELVTCSGYRAKFGNEMSDICVISEGAVVIESGIIKVVGSTAEILKQYDEDNYEVIDAGGKAVLPGFVDSHTHFVFGGYREEEFSWRLHGDSYMDIMQRGGGIANTVKGTRGASKEELIQSGIKRLNRMLSFGITTVEGKSGYGLDMETELKQLEVMEELDKYHPIDIVRTFLGAHAVPTEYGNQKDEYINYVIDIMLPVVKERNLAEFCDVFCEESVFSLSQSRLLLKKAKEMGFKLKLHADEMVELGGAELGAELGAVSADHLLKASDEGIKLLSEKGVVATLLPCTAFSLREQYARGRYMIDEGCAVALASDLNPGSCFTENISLAAALACLHMGLTIEEVITALTINGAAALGREKITGSIDPGKHGDIIILEYPSYKFIPYHIGCNSIEKVIKNGVIVVDTINKELVQKH